MVLLGHSSLKEGLMQFEAWLVIRQDIIGLTVAIEYLTSAVATLCVVGLVGYWVALRKAKP